MPRIAKHDFEVVYDTPVGAHAIARDDDGRLSGLRQAVDHVQVGLVAIDR